jgi:membrane protein YdbS with pleckstrin-like domain
VTTDALRLDRGVMFRQESVVPYTRIQHVDTEQGPIERALGLSRVTVHTASGTSSSLTIPGLAPADAEALRERLAQLAGAVEPL